MEEDRIFQEKSAEVGIMNTAFEIEVKGEEVVALHQSSSLRGIPEMVFPSEAQCPNGLDDGIQIQDISENNKKRKQPEKDMEHDQQAGVSGRWTAAEHLRFVEALKKYGQKWDNITKYVGTRNSTQVRSHAQKYFLHLEKEAKCNKETNMPAPAHCKLEPTPVTRTKRQEPVKGITVEEALKSETKKKIGEFPEIMQSLPPKISFSPVTVETPENEEFVKGIRSN